MGFRLFCFTLVLDVCLQVRGDFFDDSTDFDKIRIANTFISFYCDNCAVLKKCDKIDVTTLIEQLSKSRFFLVTLCENDRARFRKDFSALKDHIVSNADTFERLLGDDEKWQLFLLGVYYMHQVLSIVR